MVPAVPGVGDVGGSASRLAVGGGVTVISSILRHLRAVRVEQVRCEVETDKHVKRLLTAKEE